MNIKKLIIIMSISIVCVIGIVAIIVNINKEPAKIFSTELAENLGNSIIKEYYNCSDKNIEKYFSIETVDDAYNSLIDGKVGVILSVFPSEEVLLRLDKENIEIEKYPIAKDAFVFINNKVNSVANIKSDEIRKIYSKILTNWADVGGDNLEIVAYQSKAGGALYYAFKNFMDDYTLEKPKIRLRDDTFPGLINAITNYLDTRKAALGYTNFNTLKSNELNDECRILKLDNIEPTDTSIYLDEYPATFNLYLIVRKDMLENSQVKRLVEYILSDKGQTVIRESGYLTVRK